MSQNESGGPRQETAAHMVTTTTDDNTVPLSCGRRPQVWTTPRPCPGDAGMLRRHEWALRSAPLENGRRDPDADAHRDVRIVDALLYGMDADQVRAERRRLAGFGWSPGEIEDALTKARCPR